VSHFADDETLAHIAALELEVARLRSVMADVIKAHGYAGGTPVEIMSTPFTPTALQADSATAWAQAHRLALELECLLLDTKDNAIVSKWWDSGMEALSEYQELQPGAAESAEAWAKMRKAGL
jgi:hypothetical protein